MSFRERISSEQLAYKELISAIMVMTNDDFVDVSDPMNFFDVDTASVPSEQVIESVLFCAFLFGDVLRDGI